MAKIFMSYRRADSEDVAGRIYDVLKDIFGEASIFKDVYSLPLGRDFRHGIREAVAECHLMLVLIGRQWLTVTDEQGQRRLDKPSDFVRIEVEAALERTIPVVPLLVQNAEMPRESDLPQSLANLAYRTGFALRGDPYFHEDLSYLVSRLFLAMNLSLRDANTMLMAELRGLESTEDYDVSHLRSLDTRVNSLLAIGEQLRREDKPAEALKHFEHAIVLVEYWRPAWEERVITLLQLGRYEEAADTTEAALELAKKKHLGEAKWREALYSVWVNHARHLDQAADRVKAAQFKGYASRVMPNPPW